MLHVFYVNVYTLLDRGSTLSFVSSLVAMKFHILPDILKEPFSVSTPIGKFIISKNSHRSCRKLLYNRLTLVNSVELDMLNFNVVLWTD